MSEDQDQGQDQGKDESQGEEESSQDNQKSQDQEQSNKGQEESKQKEKEELFELPDGRKVDKETLSKEWKENFYPEFTRRSQKLKEFEKKEQEKAQSAEQATRQTIKQDEALKNVPPDVKEAIIKITTPVVQDMLKLKDEQTAQREADLAFETRLSEAEKLYPGGDGKPKFDRSKVLEEMKDPGNKIFDPVKKFEDMEKPGLLDYEVKQALKKQKGTSGTERTGTGDSGKPTKKTPKTFDEAGKSLLERIEHS